MSRARVWGLAVAIAAMAFIVLAANILVQYPVQGRLGAIALSDLFTWGAFTYPITFLVTDLTNRRFGAASARIVVLVGFACAILLSFLFATPRIAIASGSAFLVAQLLDVAIFDRLRRSVWWKAPMVSSFIGSSVDTLLFFSLAFAAAFSILGADNAFATSDAPLFGLLSIEAPRWVSWALGDFIVKLLVALLALLPYRVIIAAFPAVYGSAVPSR